MNTADKLARGNVSIGAAHGRRLAISRGSVAAIVSLVACLHLAVWALKNPASTARPRSNAGCRAEAKGYGRESIHALTRRVRANLSYLLRNKRVVKTGDRLTARWTLPDDSTAN
jgi:hypothetical protein